MDAVMGIKSTVTMKRSDALEMYRELHAKLYGPNGAHLTNYELSNVLEDMKDTLADRENSTNFDNFRVVDDDEYIDERESY
jgi:hypothetical protein